MKSVLQTRFKVLLGHRCAHLTWLTASVCCVGLVTSAEAQDAKSRPIEEIVVTAQRRLERLEDVPISMSVLSGVELDQSTDEGVVELLNRVPGVSTTADSGGNLVAVRGVTATSAHFFGSSPIAYYLDSVPFGMIESAIAPDSNAYDLSRVEVLRGPQGTLYGASALNGVVRILTQDANLNEFEFKGRTSAATTEEGGETYRGDMAVNVPIVEGKFAARAVAGYQDWGGWLDKSFKKDANDAVLRNMRLKLNAEPTDKLSIALSSWISRSDYGSTSYAAFDDHSTSLVDEPMSVDYDAFGLKVDYDFAAATLSSMTSYFDYKKLSSLDYFPFVQTAALLTYDIRSKVLAQEVVLNSTHEGPWHWSMGAIYRDVEDDIAFTLPPFLPHPTAWNQRSKSAAVFGQATRAFVDGRFELTAGVRYFEDEQVLREGVPQGRTRSKFDSVSPRVVLTWHPSDRATLYASYAEGFRSGLNQHQLVLSVDPNYPPIKADSLKNYEFGAKGNALGGLLSFDTAVYYIDWQDVQQSLTLEANGIPVTALVNGESASGMGFDFATTAQLTDGLQTTLSFSWNDLRMDGPVFSGGVLLFDKGDRLNLSPEYTAGISMDYSFAFGASGFKGNLSIGANHVDEQITRTIYLGAQSVGVGDAMLIGQSSFSIASPDRWTATVFVDNVNNEQGVRYAQPYGLPEYSQRIRPRTLGLQLDYHF